MSILTFTRTPPERFDDVPWVSVRVEQSATETGSYTTLATVDFDTIDVDPANPLSRSFTVEGATVGDWWRAVWVAEDLSESQPTDPVQLADTDTEAYATAAELARILKIRNPSTEQTAAMERVLLAAAGEINSEIGRIDLAGWELALAAEVNLDRAVEHWNQVETPFGLVGLGDGLSAFTSSNSWERHAFKLAPLKSSWGIG